MIRPEETPGPGSARLAELAALLGEEIEIEAVLGERSVPLGDLVEAGEGSVLLMLPRDRPLQLRAGNVDIGEGVAVEVAGRVALRIDRLRPIEEIAAELASRAVRGGGEQAGSSDDVFPLQSPPDGA